MFNSNTQGNFVVDLIKFRGLNASAVVDFNTTKQLLERDLFPLILAPARWPLLGYSIICPKKFPEQVGYQQKN